MYRTKTSLSGYKAVLMYVYFGNISVSYTMRDANVQRLIHSSDLHFDLIINQEGLYHDGFLMFAHKFNAPIVTICKKIGI